MKIKEWQRTVLLLVLLALAIIFLVWNGQSTETNFVDTLR